MEALEPHGDQHELEANVGTSRLTLIQDKDPETRNHRAGSEVGANAEAANQLFLARRRVCRAT